MAEHAHITRRSDLHLGGPTGRRSLLAALGPAAAVLIGAGATVAVQAAAPRPGVALPAAPSPVLDAVRQIAALDARINAAGPGYPPEAARLQAQIMQIERGILAAAPGTVAEAAAILMVATGDVGSALGFEDADVIAAPALDAIRRTVLFLARHAGVPVAELAGAYYLPGFAAASLAGRA